MKKNLSLPGRIRIIGGQWKGQKLTVVNNPSLRPSKSCVRETVFNWLTPSISQSNCLDCFAGSGVLGIEALSRHADSATLLEINHHIVRQLKKNLLKLKAINAKVIKTNTFTFLSKPGKSYNIIFIDPPFHQGLLIKTLMLIEHNSWIANNGFIYIESEKTNTLPSLPTHWNLYRKKVIGRVVCTLLLCKK